LYPHKAIVSPFCVQDLTVVLQQFESFDILDLVIREYGGEPQEAEQDLAQALPIDKISSCRYADSGWYAVPEITCDVEAVCEIVFPSGDGGTQIDGTTEETGDRLVGIGA
jgi:hypothetical protein